MIVAIVLLAYPQVHAAAPQSAPSALSKRYSFDALKRLRAIRHEDGSTSWTIRDFGGRAVAQTTTNLLGKAQASELFQNDGSRRIGAGGGASARRFVYGRSLDEMLFQESGIEQLSPVVSQLGSTQKALNSSGSIAQQYKYDAFGAPIAGDAKVFSQLFAGAHYDNKAKLYDLRNRHYDPRIGRFLTRDPIGMHTDAANLGNAYTYVGNNPLNRRDPLGLTTDGEAPPSIFAQLGIQVDPNTLSPQDRAILFGLSSAPYGPTSNMADPIPGDGTPIDWGGVATRVGGGLRTAGGGVEAAVGGTLVYAIGWTGIGAYIGAGIAGHGVDQMQAGARTAWTGVYTQSFTEQGITEYNVEVAGLDRPTAETAAAGLDAFASMLATFGASSGTQAMRGGLALATASGKTVVLAGEVAMKASAAVAVTQGGAILMGSGHGRMGSGREWPGSTKHYPERENGESQAPAQPPAKPVTQAARAERQVKKLGIEFEKAYMDILERLGRGELVPHHRHMLRGNGWIQEYLGLDKVPGVLQECELRPPGGNKSRWRVIYTEINGAVNVLGVVDSH